MSKKGSTRKFEFKGFHNVSIGQTEIDEFFKWLNKDNESIADAIVVLVEAGYKVGISYDDYHGTLTLALTCKDPNSNYFGMAFVFKHNDPARLIQLARFVFEKYVREELLDVNAPKNEYDW